MTSGSDDAADALTMLRREVERNALRARNGLRYLGGSRFGRAAQASPCDLVWSHGKARLWRDRRACDSRPAT